MTPDEFTNQELMLDVGDGHQIYVHDWGNPKSGTAVLYIHGGPGNGCDDRDKQKFNPETQRVIFHDQRGCGKSLPLGSLKHNRTGNLIEDIEKIIERLRLDKVILVGGSWGTTLSLAYAITYTKRVAGLVLDGVFMATKDEIDWLEKGGWKQFYPDIWEEYASSVPELHRADPTAYHAKRVLSNNPKEVKQSAYEYLKMELALLKLDDTYMPSDYDKYDPSAGQIELHYLRNNCFIPEGHILKNAHKLNMPVRIIQGRYDMVCPPSKAYKLHKALPDSELVWTISGHLRQHEAKNIQKLFIKQLIEAS